MEGMRENPLYFIDPPNARIEPPPWGFFCVYEAGSSSFHPGLLLGLLEPLERRFEGVEPMLQRRKTDVFRSCPEDI